MAQQTVAAPAIHVRGLEKSYKELHVLRGVDFDVARGTSFALLGSNGAGKTTAVKILSTLLRADAGTAGVNGFDVATQAADVPESPGQVHRRPSVRVECPGSLAADGRSMRRRPASAVESTGIRSEA